MHTHQQRQQYPAIVKHYEINTPQQFRVWYLPFGFVVSLACMIIVFTNLVYSKVQFVSTEPVRVNSIIQPPKASLLIPLAPLATVYAPDNDKLQKDIENWISVNKGVDWGVSVESMDGSLSANVNSEKTFTLASIYKLFLLQPLANAIPSDSWNSSYINSRTYTNCVDAMIRVSDNPCALAIGDKVGWGTADKYLKTLGYQNTSFLGTTTTGNTSETSNLLHDLYKSDGFDDTTRNIVIDAMAAPKTREGIRHGCSDCKVYNKIGELGGVRNDVAIIEKNGRAYSIVIFSNTGSWQQIAELTKVISAHF